MKTPIYIHVASICMLMHTQMYIYSVMCRYKMRFSELHIKCGLAKSCLGTHTGLQAPMEERSASLIWKLHGPLRSQSFC